MFDADDIEGRPRRPALTSSGLAAETGEFVQLAQRYVCPSEFRPTSKPPFSASPFHHPPTYEVYTRRMEFAKRWQGGLRVWARDQGPVATEAMFVTRNEERPITCFQSLHAGNHFAFVCIVSW